MRLHELMKWQWAGYAQYHQSRKNLLIHIVFVPTFIIAFVGLLLAVVRLDFAQMLVALLITLGSFALQGLGHNKEANPSQPFSSIHNAVLRILCEQFYSFPKFVFSGQWYRAFRASNV